MNAQIETPTPSAEVHLTAELMGKLAAAYGDTDRALADRALAVHAALAYGVDVKTMAADMAAAARADETGRAPSVSAATLGFARFAVTVAEVIGTDLRAWVKRDYKSVAAVIRAGKKHGVGPVGRAVRDSVAAIDKSKTTDREEAAVAAIDGKLAEVKAAPKTRAVKSGQEPTEDAEPAEGKRETVGAEMSARAALASVRALTAWLETGRGSWSPDLESALADLRSAATSARKRGQTEAARRTGATTETPAAV